MFRGRWPVKLSHAAVLTLLIGLVGTVALFLGLRRLEHDKAELDFQQRANVRILAVQQRMDETVQILKVINRLFATFEPVQREHFRKFTEPLLQRYPYIQAFNFHRLVTERERPSYEARMRSEHPGFAMKQLRNGSLVRADASMRHLVIDYLEPAEGNAVAFGLDVSPNKQLMDAFQYAVDTGNAVSTGLVTLAQGGGKVRGFLVLMPVYRHGMPLDDVESRRMAAVGDTAAVFNAASLVEQILTENGLLNNENIDISVYAGDMRDKQNLVFRKGVKPSESSIAAWLPHWVLYDKPDTILHDFDVAGRPWRIEVNSAPELFSVRHDGSLNGLIAGILLSILAAAYVQTIASRSRKVHRLVEQRTAELREANDLLIADVAGRKRAEKGLRLRQRAIDASANAVIITSAAPPYYPIEYVNPAFERITGYSAADIIGRSCSVLWQHDQDQPEIQEIRAAVRESREGHVIMRNYTKNGSMFWADAYIAPVRDESDEVNHYVVAMYDITATKRYQAELEFQANRDTLTGLANRSLLQDRLQQACAYAERYGNAVWVMFVNLDRFKFVNDTLGRGAGDLLLKEIAERLRNAVRDTDTVARLSADEFVVVLPECAEEILSPVVVQRIKDAVCQPVVIEGYEFVLGTSIGIAVCPTDGADADTLIKHAGVAMYRVKETDRNSFQFFTPAMNDRAMERLRIEGDLRTALERGHFLLHYQPQIDLETGNVFGMEALIRWQHPELGMISPARFISLAEETGLIVPIGEWVLRTACRQCAEWQSMGNRHIRVAVNLSARQFYERDLVTLIRSVLEETGIAPHLLELELTESMMMSDVDHAVEILYDLKQLGVHLSIDDFGTGYSSLAYLKRFPIDLLKIDQSFVRDITVDPDDAAIVRSVISLAHSLRLKVIAEGVETEDQLRYLQEHGCDYMQGYYFSRPMTSNECMVYLNVGARDRVADGSKVSRIEERCVRGVHSG